MVDGRRVPPESIIEVNLRRLERLARYNLVTRLPDGNWKVPPNLVEILRDRERTHPQHRIEVERVDQQKVLGRGLGLGEPRTRQRDPGRSR
jgi:hypothetical protein